jgi:hypothetical protein
MKPRVFVSSTYYDLKYVRERLERFIRGYNFEPVLFENDNVTFEHGKPLDLSCYNEINLCHIMILLIGGRYGSVISGENTERKKEFYNKEYTSITRKEFETAAKKNIPTFIFIDKNVYAEYQTYKKNQNELDKENSEFVFAHVDDKNIFKFINSIEGNITNAIKTFENVEEIEHYLSEQIAGLFYLYLEQLQKNQKEKEILDTVSELKSLSKGMGDMLNAVGKKVIDEENYKNIIFEQNEKIIDFFVEQFRNNLTFEYEFPYEESEEIAKNILRICNETLFDSNFLILYHRKDFYDRAKKTIDEFTKKILALNEKLVVRSIWGYDIIRSYYNNIYPIISDKANFDKTNLNQYFEKKMIYAIHLLVSKLPF